MSSIVALICVERELAVVVAELGRRAAVRAAQVAAARDLPRDDARRLDAGALLVGDRRRAAAGAEADRARAAVALPVAGAAGDAGGVTARMTGAGTAGDAGGMAARDTGGVTCGSLGHACGNLGVAGWHLRGDGDRDACLAAACLGFGHLLLGDGRVGIFNGARAAFELLFELEIGTRV